MKFRIIRLLVDSTDFHKFSCQVLLAVKLILWRVYQVQLLHKQLLTNRIQINIFKNFYTIRVNLWINMIQADPITSLRASRARICFPTDRTALKKTKQVFLLAITNLQWRVLSKLLKESNKSKLSFFITFNLDSVKNEFHRITKSPFLTISTLTLHFHQPNIQ